MKWEKIVFEALAAIVRDEVSPDRALRHAREIHRFEGRYSYRYFQRSAKYCASALREMGVGDVEVIEHPADGVTTYMDCVMPMAWDVRGARLEIAEPAGAEPSVLADWRASPFCVAQWSVGTRPGGVEAEVVTAEQMRGGADVRGKIVLNSTLHHPRRIKKEVADRGGIGVVSDWTENYSDTPDGIYWNNEWSQGVGGWYGGQREDMESAIWCMSITPRTGMRLRGMMASARKPVRLRATIKARLYKGVLPTVTGIIPGTSGTRQEVLLLAHLYEPMPHDNAVGAAALLEIVRAIQALVRDGTIPRSRRTIRVIFNQEMHGLSAYLATHPRVRSAAIAALNLDGVACDPRTTGMPISVCTNPEPQASFTDPLFRAIAGHCFERYAPAVAWKITTGGSDDNFISDPSIGIPSNRLFTPEGRYHHSSTNDWSIISPEILHLSMTVCGAFTHFVSTAGPKEGTWLADRITAEARSRMDQAVEELFAAAASEKTPDVGLLLEGARRRLEYAETVETNRLAGLKGLDARGDATLAEHVSDMAGEIAEAGRQVMTRARRRAKTLKPAHPKPARAVASNEELLARNMTPTRKTMGPMVNYHRIPRSLRDKVAANASDPSLWWIDGRRNVLEIARMMNQGDDPPASLLRRLLAFFRALDKAGYVDVDCAKTLDGAQVKAALRRIGVKEGDVVLMHSSLSHSGPIAGGADAVIEAMMATLGPTGTLVVPTNYDNAVIGVTDCGDPYRYPPEPPHVPAPWDPDESPAYTGAIPNRLWPRSDVIRSTHPTHSVAAWGKLAEEFVEGHGPDTPCCGPAGPYRKMVDYNGKFLFFACSLNSATFLHALEDWADLGYMPAADVLMKRGGEVVTVKSLHYPEGCRSFYRGPPNKVTRKLDELKVPIRRVRLGFSDLQLIRARDLHRLLGVLEDEPDLMLCDREGCRFCTWARQRIAENRKRSARRGAAKKRRP